MPLVSAYFAIFLSTTAHRKACQGLTVILQGSVNTCASTLFYWQNDSNTDKHYQISYKCTTCNEPAVTVQC
jgi:hypothetical protein